MKRRFAPLLLPVVLLATACRYERPIHPYRLEGWPGAPVEGELFPLRHGTRWVFRDALDERRPALTLDLTRQEGRWILSGRAQGAVELRRSAGYLEVWQEGRLVERPLPLTGRVGDSWKATSGRAFAFGYDRLHVLGQERRALVVAIDRDKTRDLIWFSDGLGWVRFRTERSGKPIRDAFLVEHRAGASN